MSGFNRLLKNSLANIINGFSNVILGIVISPFLISILTKDEFSVWSLSLQAGMLISIIGAAGQVTIGRFVSLFKSRDDNAGFCQLINNYFSLLMPLIVLCFFGLFIVVALFESIFPGVPLNLINEAKISFFIISFSFIASLSSSIFIGYFIGIERNAVCANINIISRIILGLVAVLSANLGLVALAVSFLTINVLSYYFMYRAFCKEEKHKFCVDIKASSSFSDLKSSFFGLTIWNAAQFLISGAGIFVVSVYHFNSLAYFALAMILVNASVGIFGAAINPVIQPIVKLIQSGRADTVDKLVINLSFIFALIAILISCTIGIISPAVIRFWLDDSDAKQVSLYFDYLLIANIIRLVAAPYGMKLVADARQLKVAYYPIVEGLLNFVLSIYFVRLFGVVGVAYATAISAVLILFVYSVRYYLELSCEKKRYLIFIVFFVIPIFSLLITYYSGFLFNFGFYYIFGLVVFCLGVSIFIFKLIISVKNIINECV
jgi:O-antigen/teichoic acid export membrane protein